MGEYQVVAIDDTTGRAIVAFHASNTWDVKSATRNPLGEKTSGGPTGPSSGKFSALTTNFYWTETVSF